MNATVLIRDGRKKAITRLASPTPASYRIFQFSVIPSFLTAAVSHVPDNVALNFFSSIKGKTITSRVSPFPYHLKAHTRAWPCNLCALSQGGMFWGSWGQAVKSSSMGSVLWGAALSAGLLLSNANRSTKTWYFQVDHTKADHGFHTAGAVWVSFNILNW